MKKIVIGFLISLSFLSSAFAFSRADCAQDKTIYLCCSNPNIPNAPNWVIMVPNTTVNDVCASAFPGVSSPKPDSGCTIKSEITPDGDKLNRSCRLS